MRLLYVVTVIGAALLCVGAAPATHPAGWRELTDGELASARARSGVADQVFAVEADFDGDGRVDRAALLANERDQIALFVRRAATVRYQRLDYLAARAELQNIGLSVEAPDRYETYCGQTNGHACRGRRQHINPRWPAIGASYFEASFALFFWDGRKFDHDYLTD